MYKMSTLYKYVNIIILSTILLLITHSSLIPCSNTTQLTGCLSCDPTPANQSRIFNINTQKYICTDDIYCILMLNDTGCKQCVKGYYVKNGICQIYSINISINCVEIDIMKDVCVKCEIGYKIVKGKCVGQIDNCQQYNDNGTCISCIFDYLQPSLDCLIPLNICLLFSYSKLQCLQCPNSLIISSTGQYCISSLILPNCFSYNHLGCTRCQQQYIIDPNSTINNYNCIFNIQLQYNNVIIQNLSGSLKVINICKDQMKKYDQNKGICELISIQGQCNEKYYYNQSSKICVKCQTNIQKCINCVNNTYCLACQQYYFIDIINNKQSTICRPCSIYNCKSCQSINELFQCFSCQRGYQLFNKTCIKCDQGTYYDIFTKKCSPCPQNCSYCQAINGDKLQCIWCNEQFVLNKNKQCEDKQSILSTNMNINSVYEIFIKSFLSHQQLIFQDSIKLMSSCRQSANLYSCICSNSLYSSLCYNINNFIDKYDLKAIVGLTSIKIMDFIQNSHIFRVLSELNTFDKLNFQLDYSIPMPESKVADLMQVYTNILRRFDTVKPNRRLLQYTNKNQILNQILKFISTQFPLIYPSTQVISLYGNGYYIKYYPKDYMPTSQSNNKDNKQFIYTNNLTANKTTILFTWFDKITAQRSKSLSGNLVVYSESNNSISIKIRQLFYPATNYQIFLNNKQDNIIVTSRSLIQTNDNTFISFNVNPQTSLNLVSYPYYSITFITKQSIISQLYFSQRIQNIFYQPAFVYILIFLVLYLFLIPFCSIVDLCNHNKINRRKRVKSEDINNTEQQNNHKQSDENYDKQQQKQSIYVNYRDFFPIYNISNTPRPRRIVKLCLFLLNLQHCITFLTLIYFDLQPQHPVLAVVLGLPAYFCSIIMAYICGLLTLYLPSFTKYFINLITAGYWIIWIILMPRFVSSEYHPYVFVFAIAFFFIDMLIDLLQTFMVYFTINQSEKQIKMFQCLAAWLSKRGFYQYDKLAKQLI